MKLNNKGMAISGILYSILVLFIVLVFGVLSLLASTKYSFDKFKYDLKEKLEATNVMSANEDYMLMSHTESGTADQSIFKTLYPTQFNTIKSVSFITSSSIPATAIEIKDISKTQNDNVKSYLISREDGGYDLYVSSNSSIYTNYDSSHLFSGLSSVIKYNLSNLNTRATTNFFSFFKDNKSIGNIDVSHFDTSNATNLIFFFYNCNSLTMIDLSNWNTNKVINMQHMFYSCQSLTEIDLSNLDTSNVSNMASVFYNCQSLEKINLSNWDTSNVTKMNDLFRDCWSLKSIDVSHFDVKNLITMTGMFYACQSLTEIDLSTWNTESLFSITYIDGDVHLGLFENCNSLKKIKFGPKWNTKKVSIMSYVFNGCTSLEEVNLSNWNTSKVTTMKYMFAECSSLENIDVSHFDTSSVTDMSKMFLYCTSLKALDLSNWDTGNVTNMNAVFQNCESITSLDLSNWNTSKVTTMVGLFHAMQNLTTINVSGWDTSNVTTASEPSFSVFSYCLRLTEIIGINDWDVSKISNFQHMFWANRITSLDLSNWDTRSATNMTSMFSNMEGLRTLNISSFDFTNVTNLDAIFSTDNLLSDLTLKNYIASNILDDYLPDRSSLSTGKITLMGDCSGIQSNILSSKNWEVYDTAGNGVTEHSGGSN